MRLIATRLVRPALRPAPTLARTFKKKSADPADKPVDTPGGAKLEADAFVMGDKSRGPAGAADGQYSAGALANDEAGFAAQRNTPDVNAEADAEIRKELKKEGKK